MKQKIIKIGILLCALQIIALQLFAQKITISGYIKDSLTHETIMGATVVCTDYNIATTTNSYGYYSLSIPSKDAIEIEVRFISYKTKNITVATQIKQVTVFLCPKISSVKEVKVFAKKKDTNIKNTQMSRIELSTTQIKSIPMIAGERDVLKAIQYLPGVQAGNEGTTGFFVRGGNADQNLVLLDEATVYNPNHLFGLFSTFNVNALKNISLIKGGFPAQYGGRLSSILDIAMRDGNKNRYSTEGGIGLLSSNITLEGPLQKGQSSFIISGRRSYIDIISKPFIPKNLNNTNYYLYDVNVKTNYELGKNDKLFLSYFKGLDNAQYTASNSLNYGIDFGNTTGTIRWNHIIGSKIFVNTSLIFNKYHLGLSTTQNNYYAILYTGIRDKSIKSIAEYHPDNKHTIKFGTQYSKHDLTPASVSAKIPKKGTKIVINQDSLQHYYSTEVSAFVNDEWIINDKIGINAGVRVPYFFTKNKKYILIEPRISTKFGIDNNTSIKLSYTEMNQFLHLIPNSTASLPTDIWISSSSKIKPQQSHQTALGFFKNFKNNAYETSAEIYYKTMSNQVLFKHGTQIVLESAIEDKLTFGSGKSYGIEFFVRKTEGALTGFASYTLSKTTQQFDSLNYGKVFPFTYDRRHVLNIVASYKLTKRWSFSVNFVYNTGIAFTLPTGRVPVIGGGGTLYEPYYNDYTERNNYRLGAYHRMDIGASYKKNRILFHKKYESEINFSLYNVYSRSNPYFVYLSTDAVTKQPIAKQVSLLPIIPGFSYNFKF